MFCRTFGIAMGFCVTITYIHSWKEKNPINSSGDHIYMYILHRYIRMYIVQVHYYVAHEACGRTKLVDRPKCIAWWHEYSSLFLFCSSSYSFSLVKRALSDNFLGCSEATVAGCLIVWWLQLLHGGRGNLVTTGCVCDRQKFKGWVDLQRLIVQVIPICYITWAYKLKLTNRIRSLIG